MSQVPACQDLVDLNVSKVSHEYRVLCNIVFRKHRICRVQFALANRNPILEFKKPTVPTQAMNLASSTPRGVKCKREKS